LALATLITPQESLQCQVCKSGAAESVKLAAPSVACVPYAQSYKIYPSTPDLCTQFAKKTIAPLVLFIPMQSGGGVLHASPRTTDIRLPGEPPLPPSNTSQLLQAFTKDNLKKYFSSICRKSNIVGIFIDVSSSIYFVISIDVLKKDFA
jgi:hypothetical protein